MTIGELATVRMSSIFRSQITLSRPLRNANVTRRRGRQSRSVTRYRQDNAHRAIASILPTVVRCTMLFRGDQVKEARTANHLRAPSLVSPRIGGWYATLRSASRVFNSSVPIAHVSMARHPSRRINAARDILRRVQVRDKDRRTLPRCLLSDPGLICVIIRRLRKDPRYRDNANNSDPNVANSGSRSLNQ